MKYNFAGFEAKNPVRLGHEIELYFEARPAATVLSIQFASAVYPAFDASDPQIVYTALILYNIPQRAKGSTPVTKDK